LDYKQIYKGIQLNKRNTIKMNPNPNTENIIEEDEEEEELTCDDCECDIKANQYRCYAVGCVTYCVCLTCYTKWIILNKD